MYPLTNTVLPNTLFYAAKDYSLSRLAEFIGNDWRYELKRQLIYNPYEFLPVPLPAIAQMFPNNFPSPVVVKYLATPSLVSFDVSIDSLCSEILVYTEDSSSDGDEYTSDADECSSESEDIGEVEQSLLFDN